MQPTEYSQLWYSLHLTVESTHGYHTYVIHQEYYVCVGFTLPDV